MGIDAVILVRPKVMPDDQTLRRLGYSFAVASGMDSTFKQWFGLLRPSIYDPQFLQLKMTLERYAARGYDRGVWPRLYAAIRWLRENFPGCDVYYFPDTEDVIPDRPLSLEDEAELWRAWHERPEIDEDAPEECCGGPLLRLGDDYATAREGLCELCNSRYVRADEGWAKVEWELPESKTAVRDPEKWERLRGRQALREQALGIARVRGVRRVSSARTQPPHA